MKSFKMRAQSLKQRLVEFTLYDVPVNYDGEHIALTHISGSPLLIANTITRGADILGVYEGDIVSSDEGEFLICYERGFYAIDKNYRSLYLYQLHNVKVIGNYHTMDFPVPIAIRGKQLFKYDNISFRLLDIIGGWPDKLVIRASKQPLNTDNCQQECGMRYNKSKLFLGDIVDDTEVELIGGRICIRKDEGIFDLAKGEILDGYNP